jgi:hypothetical protein
MCPWRPFRSRLTQNDSQYGCDKSGPGLEGHERGALCRLPLPVC